MAKGPFSPAFGHAPPSVALEPMTIKHLTLVVAVAVFRYQAQNLLEHLPGHGALGHLEGNAAAVADHLRADLD
jgi:hypothetical protein